MKKIIATILTLFSISLVLVACGQKQADYPSSAKAESALNAGKNINGKTVSFKVAKVVPNGTLGHTMWAGKHLNFISDENPKISVKKGDTVTVKIKKAKSALGSWLITYTDLSK